MSGSDKQVGIGISAVFMLFSFQKASQDNNNKDIHTSTLVEVIQFKQIGINL